MKRFLGLLCVLSLTVSFIGFSDNASALSEYDDTVQISKSAIITCFSENQNGEKIALDQKINLTGKIGTLLNPETTEIDDVPVFWAFSGKSRQQMWEQFMERLSALEGYGMTTQGDFYAGIIISRNSTVQPAIFENPDGKQLRVPNADGISIFCQEYQGQKNLRISGPETPILSKENGTTKVVQWAGDITYPEGYDGENVPDKAPTPASNSDWAPNINLHRGEKWLVELSDYNFYTTDMNLPFLCGEEGFAPIINWEVWDISEGQNRTLIDTLTFSASAVVKYQAPKTPQDKKYEIVAYYSDCDGLNFTERSSKEFTVLKDGRLNPRDFMTVCLDDQFPFIHIADCMAEFNDYLAMMSFNMIQTNNLGGGTFAQLSTGCRKLQVLDDWILAPNQTVCPAIPAGVRNTVTPFVVFTVGLLTARFISRKQGGV